MAAYTANAIRVQSSLVIINGGLNYASRPGSFTASQTVGANGPTPGALLASKFGTVVNLSALIYLGGFCEIKNNDPVNVLRYGIYDLESGPISGRYIPFGKLLPGESTTLRLDELLGQEIGTGSGTHALESGLQLMVKGEPTACSCCVNAFDA